MASQPIQQTSTLFDIKELHFEVSTKCVLKCPRCPRTELKDDLHPSLNLDYTLDEFKTIFPAEVLQEINTILFCGDKGDPIYAREFVEIVEYIKSTKPKLGVSIVTNGSYKDANWWTRLGTALNDHDRVTFSVDGYDNKTNNLYRVNSDWDSIILGVKTLSSTKEFEQRCLIRWSSIKFAFNMLFQESIKTIATDAGADEIQFVTSTKFGSIDQRYLNDNGIDELDPNEYNSATNLQVYKKRTTGITGKRQKGVNHVREIRTDSGAEQVWHLPGSCWQHCQGTYKTQMPFISGTGLLYPCAWFDSGYIKNSFVEKHRDRMNVRTRPILDIINDPMWEELSTSWEIAPLEICRLKCYKHAK